jgi:transposase
VVWATPAQPIVFQAYVRAVNEQTERLQRLAPARHDHVKTWRLQPVVEALQALRGVQFPVAVTLGTALGDLTRFATPRPLMTYLGLIPSAYAIGERRRQGAITQAGHTHARRALVEGASGPIAIRRTSVATSNCGSKHSLKSSRPSAGKPKSDFANAIDASPHVAHMPTRWLSPWPGNWRAFCGPRPKRFR